MLLKILDIVERLAGVACILDQPYKFVSCQFIIHNDLRSKNTALELF